MRVSISDSQISIWLSSRDTYDWANRPDNVWPCSDLSGKRIFASFNSNGLFDLSVNNLMDSDVNGNKLSACIADHLASRLPKDHPLYFIVVGQFQHE